jgi:hypothetical protein
VTRWPPTAQYCQSKRTLFVGIAVRSYSDDVAVVQIKGWIKGLTQEGKTGLV